MEPTVFNADGTTRPTSPGGPRLNGATLESQTPTEAEIGRLVMTLSVVDGAWKVGSARFVIDGAVYAGAKVDLASNTTQPVDAAMLRSAAAAWSRLRDAEGGFPTLEALTDADVPEVRAAMTAMSDAVNMLGDALRGTPSAIREDDVRAFRQATSNLVAEIDREPKAANVVAIMRDRARFDAATQAFDRIRAVGESLVAATDAAEEARPTTTRPAVVGAPVPVRLAWLKDELVRLRGPIGFPAWLKSTRAWQQWEQQHDVKVFRTRDDDGSVYEVSIGGAFRDRADGPVQMNLQSVRRYRRDGTLSAIAENFFGGFANTWGELDETGHRYTFRASASAREGVPCLNEVKFFAADGAIRYWYTSQDARNRVWWERVQDPIGENELTTHLVHDSGGDDGHPADDLPIDGLPIERGGQ